MNASPSPPAGSPYSWLAHAKSDLRITQICRSDSGVLPNQTVFHAQQAAEKAIKAVLLEHKIRFPRTHDWGELIVHRVRSYQGARVLFSDGTSYGSCGGLKTPLEAPGFNADRLLVAKEE